MTIIWGMWGYGCVFGEGWVEEEGKCESNAGEWKVVDVHLKCKQRDVDIGPGLLE
jgi:hypothetical protein